VTCNRVLSITSLSLIIKKSADGHRSQDRSVRIAIRYWLDSRGTGIRFPAWARLPLLYSVQLDCGAHPASYPVVIEDSFPRGMEAEA
jgi:hypothetical protein